MLLAYANGANDNFKGVATLYGSGVLSFRTALVAGTAATWFGSVAALLLAGELIKAFSGKGLVAPEVLGQGDFAVSVSAGAALTVLLATRLGFPISTTHALVGGLVGAGISTGTLQAERLASAFLLPLALSPLLAASLAGFGYLLLRTARQALGVVEDDCLCIDTEVSAPALAPAGPGAGLGNSVAMTTMPSLRAGRSQDCRVHGRTLPGMTSLRLLDLSHVASGILVSFARGLNDTPKIAGILLIGTISAGAASEIYGQQVIIVGIATIMALGGLLSARRVARVMALEITDMNEGQGFAANLITSVLVLCASKVGVPVSTTHVSCGSLFGIGAAGGGGHWSTIAGILGAWVVTLPVAAAITALIYWVATVILT
ncbi:MAG: inorganic phosphate transporter [bacterium]|nr:inorganic phosphate transporter [bacterium]